MGSGIVRIAPALAAVVAVLCSAQAALAQDPLLAPVSFYNWTGVYVGANLGYPRFIEVETVNACNARCPMCTIGEWQRHTPTMKDALFAKIADDICSHADEVRRVALYRDGEPLLDKKLAKRGGDPQAGRRPPCEHQHQRCTT
jgi:sulfatase maturation enzyme AslB (radical SAM superfamily)